MLTQTITYLPSIIGIFGIALFVLARSKQATFRIFGLFTISLGVWQVLQYLTDSRVGGGVLLLEFVSAITFVIAVLFVAFAYAYPHHDTLGRRYLILLLAPGALILPASFTSLVVKNVEYMDTGVRFTAGPFYSVVTIVALLYFLTGAAILVRRLHGLDYTQRKQIYTLLIAFGIGVGGNVISGVLFVDSVLWQMARPLSILLMVAIIAYAMIYQRLFDIKTYALRTVAYFLTFSITALAYLLGAVAVSRLVLHFELTTGVAIYLAFITIIVAALFGPVRSYFKKLTNKLFYRDYYDPQDLLDRVSNVLVGTVDVSEIRVKIQDIFDATIRPTSMRIMLTADSNAADKVALDHLLASDFSVITADEVNDQKHAILYRTLHKMEVSLAVRLRTKHEDLGFIVLGARRSGQFYTSTERRVIGVIADEMAIGLQNALRFRQIERFNATLQQKIEDATRQLRRTNEKLRQLDQTKDDFISMASHQLRTPLTSVKGYVSMVLEGDAGSITPLQRKLLNQSFVSSQRMVYLISDLLNVSRLRTGKFIIEPVRSNLADVIKDEVEQLQETAKGRNLTLSYSKPEHFPVLMFDETKMRQVIMNFMDNAIYYTPAGGAITVSLVDKPTTIEFTVVDNGIGVPKHEQFHLFSKFYRAHNAKRARPDGTGLGLFMAKKVIVAQGGAIIFKSKEKAGSTFGFTFAKAPLLPEAHQPVSAVLPTK